MQNMLRNSNSIYVEGQHIFGYYQNVNKHVTNFIRAHL